VKRTKETVGRTIVINSKRALIFGEYQIKVSNIVFPVELQHNSGCGYNLHRRMVHRGAAEKVRNLI
jgi:hypothetical protein